MTSKKSGIIAVLGILLLLSSYRLKAGDTTTTSVTLEGIGNQTSIIYEMDTLNIVVGRDDVIQYLQSEQIPETDKDIQLMMANKLFDQDRSRRYKEVFQVELDDEKPMKYLYSFMLYNTVYGLMQQGKARVIIRGTGQAIKQIIYQQITDTLGTNVDKFLLPDGKEFFFMVKKKPGN